MPSMLATATATATRTRPSSDAPVPDDVTDVMLWRLAFDVTVAHQPDPNGNCTNLRCAGQRGRCEPATHAQHALRAARRLTALTPAPPNPTPPIVATDAPVTDPHRAPAIGRAPVIHPNTGPFTGWFTHTPAAAAERWRAYDLPQRIPGAVQAAA
jgi:hypothetical protein